MLARTILVSLMLSGLLVTQSCTTVATTGASAIYNHQSIEKSANDQYITMRSYQAIDIDSDHFRNANINVATFNRVVLISGQVPEAWQKSEAETIIRKVASTDKVYNLMTVEPPSSQQTRLADAWITTKIKTKLFAAHGIDATNVKVVTENHTVYLMGILRPKEAQIAINAASNTDGVGSVVKIFSYLNLSKVPNEAEG